MALELEELLILLGADTSALGPDLASAEKQTSNWATSIGGNIAGVMGGAVVAGAAAAAVAVGAIGVAAFNVSKDTDQAARDIAASLGIPIEQAERFADVAQNVYGNNFADSIGEAGEAVALLEKNIEGLNDARLQGLSEKAFAVKDAFGIEVAQSIDAATTLVDNFGISGEEAFDLIVAGQQRGLNRSGDFLDTIGEYSTQFSEGGASAEEFFNFLESGLQGGVLGLDKGADAFKEFRLRINDGTEATEEAVAALFKSEEAAAQLFEEIRSGETDAVTAFGQISDALADVEDPIERMEIGTALLGTQFEDLGDSAALGLGFAGNAFEDLEGRADSLNNRYESLGDFFSGLWRRTAIAVSPLTDKILDLANSAMPAIEGAFVQFEDNVIPAIDSVIAILDVLTTSVSNAKDFLIDLFTGDDFEDDIESNVAQLDVLREWFDENLPRVQQIIERVLNSIKTFWENNGRAITAATVAIWDIIKIYIDTTINNVLDLVTLVLQLLNGEWEAAGETLRGIVSRTWDAITEIFQTAIDAIIAIFRDVNWREIGENAMSALLGGIEAIGGAITGFISGLVGDMAAEFTEKDWGAIGSNIVTVLWDGFRENWADFTGWFKNQLSGLSNLLPDFGGFFGGGGAESQSVGEPTLFNGQSLGDAVGLPGGSEAADVGRSLVPAAGATNSAQQTIINIYNTVASAADIPAMRTATRLGVLEAARAAGI